MNSTPTLPSAWKGLDYPTKLALALKLSRIAERESVNPDFLRFQSDPVAYAREVLGVTLTPEQIAVALSVRDNRYTLVKASHSIGKTFLAGILANWWFDCWPENIVYITAPTWDQAHSLTFNQVKRFRMDARLPGRVMESGWVKDTDRRLDTSHFIRTLNAERGEGFQGQHAAPILLILEEGPGVPLYIWQAARGLMTDFRCRLLAIGNPTDEATPFGAAADNPLYNVLTVSGLEHPNIAAGLACEPEPFPGAVNLLWLSEMLSDEAEVVETPAGDTFQFHDLATIQAALAGEPVPAGTPLVHWQPTGTFQGRVLGEFPTEASASVIPPAWLANLPIHEPEGPPVIGCDVARHGDDRTTIFVRQGYCALAGREIRRMDTVEVTGALVATAEEWGAKCGVPPKKVAINIDVTGGLGAGPYDSLRAQGYAAVAVNSSERANEKTQYHNRRSEMWFETRLRAYHKQLDLSRLPLELRRKLTRELSQPKYKNDATGHKVVEAKDVTKKALLASPDLADGFNLAFTIAGKWYQDAATMARAMG